MLHASSSPPVAVPWLGDFIGSGGSSRAAVGRYVLKRLTRRIRPEQLINERLAEPLHPNFASVFVAPFGSFRAKVGFDLILRQQRAWPILRAGDQARNLGYARRPSQAAARDPARPCHPERVRAMTGRCVAHGQAR